MTWASKTSLPHIYALPSTPLYRGQHTLIHPPLALTPGTWVPWYTRARCLIRKQQT